MRKSILRSVLFTAVLVASAPAPAFAEQGTSVVQAMVPLRCSARLNADSTESAGSMVGLGNVAYFCNSRFELQLTHKSLATGTNLLVNGQRGTSVDSELYSREFAPGFGSMSLTLDHGSQAEAREIADTMTVTINALGL